jgi:tetratricopeptide (TPR) repeat protein
VLYSSGLLGLASLGWLLLAVLRQFRQRFYQAEGVDRALFVGAAAALVSFLAHSFFDSLHNTPGLMLILMTALAAGLESRSSAASRSSLQQWSGRGIQLLGILIAAYAWFYIWQISPIHRAVEAVHSGDLQTGAALMSEASRRAPHDPFVFEQLGLIYSVQIEQGDSSRWEDAIHAFNRAAELNPYWSIHHANLGSLYRSQGDLDAARQAFRSAAALAPGWYAYPLELAEIEEQRGDQDAAAAAYRQAIALWPDWAPVEYWQGSLSSQRPVCTIDGRNAGRAPE